MTSHAFLRLHILTLIYSWRSIAREARETRGNRTPNPQLVGISMCVCVVCVDIAVMLCLIYVMFVTL